MRVFFPREFSKGHVFRSLDEEHGRIRGPRSLFRVKDVEAYSSNIPINILLAADSACVTKYASTSISDDADTDFDDGTI